MAAYLVKSRLVPCYVRRPPAKSTSSPRLIQTMYITKALRQLWHNLFPQLFRQRDVNTCEMPERLAVRIVGEDS